MSQDQGSLLTRQDARIFYGIENLIQIYQSARIGTPHFLISDEELISKSAAMPLLLSVDEYLTREQPCPREPFSHRRPYRVPDSQRPKLRQNEVHYESREVDRHDFENTFDTSASDCVYDGRAPIPQVLVSQGHGITCFDGAASLKIADVCVKTIDKKAPQEAESISSVEKRVDSVRVLNLANLGLENTANGCVSGGDMNETPFEDLSHVVSAGLVGCASSSSGPDQGGNVNSKNREPQEPAPKLKSDSGYHPTPTKGQSQPRCQSAYASMSKSVNQKQPSKVEVIDLNNTAQKKAQNASRVVEQPQKQQNVDAKKPNTKKEAEPKRKPEPKQPQSDRTPSNSGQVLNQSAKKADKQKRASDYESKPPAGKSQAKASSQDASGLTNKQTESASQKNADVPQMASFSDIITKDPETDAQQKGTKKPNNKKPKKDAISQNKDFWNAAVKRSKNGS